MDSKFQFIMVPGLGGSGESHWQTNWEKLNPDIIRVEQEDWDNPICENWVLQLEKVLLSVSSKPVILISHSLGCVTVLHALAQQKLHGVIAVFMVAMPDVSQDDFPKSCEGFTPLPNAKFPFPALMVGSTNDPYISAEKLAELSYRMNANFISVGEQGHIGSAANLGNWEEGKILFENFLTESIFKTLSNV